MLDPGQEMIVNLATSCTRQAAAAKLLGWMRGPIYPKYVQMTERGAPIDQQPFLASPEDSLAEQLAILLERERQRVIDAFDNDLTSEECGSRLDELLKWEKQINLAAAYLRDIDDELAKGDTSELKLDKLLTDNSDGLYITLNSLDKWARRKYEISIFEESPIPSSGVVNEPPINKNPAMNAQSGYLSATLSAPPDMGSSEGGLGKIKTNNVLITLAFLVDIISESATKFKTGGRPNVETIAAKLEETAFIANNNNTLRGQTVETIRKLIPEAQKLKASALGRR